MVKIIKSKNNLMHALLVGSLLLLLSGCLALAGAAAGAAGVAYAQGALRGTVKVSPPQYIAAAEKTFQERNITVMDKAIDPAESRINGKTSNNRDVVITATRVDEGISEISIRVDVFGDENLSREIYNNIAEKL
jgi:hypothetical protein